MIKAKVLAVTVSTQLYSYIATNIHMYNYTFADSTTFAVIKAKEEYETLALGFKECFQQLNRIINNGVITINHKIYGLKCFMCCDYKVHKYSCMCTYICLFNTKPHKGLIRRYVVIHSPLSPLDNL